jgi:hypothetical protein
MGRRSPVYKELVGIKPVDWSGVRTARAKYFGDVFADWKARVQVAKMNGWPGDILTLAHDAPTTVPLHPVAMERRRRAAQLHRFEAALSGGDGTRARFTIAID